MAQRWESVSYEIPLTIPVAVSTDGERGLLPMAFSPDYATTGRFYVCCTDAGGEVQIDELQERQLTTG